MNSAGELLGQDEVQALLDELETSQPNLVQTVVPKIIPLHQLTKVLQNLLKEAVPISDLHVVISELSAINVQKMSNDDISEAIRPKLVPLLIQRLTKFKETLPLLTLAPSGCKASKAEINFNGALQSDAMCNGSFSLELFSFAPSGYASKIRDATSMSHFFSTAQ